MTGKTKLQLAVHDPIPGAPELSKSRLWDAIANAALLDTGDQGTANQIADRVTSLVEVGAHAEKHNRRAEIWSGIRHFLAAALVFLVIIAAGAGLAWFFYGIASHGDHDYAGYGPSKVSKHSAQAVFGWYGDNDLPPNLRIVSQKRDLLYGQPAWKVTYLSADNKTVCAYVWKAKANPGDVHKSDLYKVEEGSDCRQ